MGLQAVMDQLAPVGVSRPWATEAFMAVKMEVSGVTHVQDHQGEVAAMVEAAAAAAAEEEAEQVAMVARLVAPRLAF